MSGALWTTFLDDHHVTMQEAGWRIELEQQHSRSSRWGDAYDARTV
jgi:hypothetical protein